MHTFAAIGYGLATLTVLLVVAFLATVIGRSLRPKTKEAIERLADEPVMMTVDSATRIAGLHVKIGDMIETFRRAPDSADPDRREYIPKARRVRVVTLSGVPILACAADTRALATALVEFAKEQERAA
jgi:hypothetical protein